MIGFLEQLEDDPPLKVCYLVAEFPHLSEAFLAYEFAEISKRTTARLIARHRPETPAEHPILQEPAFQSVRYLEHYRHNFRTFGCMSQILITQGLGTDSVIAAKHLGYKTMAQCVRQVAQCLTALRGFEPDVIHAHFAGMAQLANVVARELRIPYVVAVHGSDIRFKRYEMTDRALREADAIVCGSRDDQDIMVREVGVDAGSTRIIHYAVDTKLFRPRAEGDSGYLLAVGRLHEVKGYDILIDAAAILERRGVDFSLNIMGDGPERAALARRIDNLGLQDRVRLLAPRMHGELPEAYAQAQLVVMPSRSEGFGCVALEAMACGRPIVAARVGGLQEAIEQDIGFLCEPESPQSLADALAEALSSPERLRTMGRRAREVAIEKYQYGRCADQLVGVWKSSLERYRSGAEQLAGA